MPACHYSVAYIDQSVKAGRQDKLILISTDQIFSPDLDQPLLVLTYSWSGKVMGCLQINRPHLDLASLQRASRPLQPLTMDFAQRAEVLRAVIPRWNDQSHHSAIAVMMISVSDELSCL